MGWKIPVGRNERRVASSGSGFNLAAQLGQRCVVSSLCRLPLRWCCRLSICCCRAAFDRLLLRCCRCCSRLACPRPLLQLLIHQEGRLCCKHLSHRRGAHVLVGGARPPRARRARRRLLSGAAHRWPGSKVCFGTDAGHEDCTKGSHMEAAALPSTHPPTHPPPLQAAVAGVVPAAGADAVVHHHRPQQVHWRLLRRQQRGAGVAAASAACC